MFYEVWIERYSEEVWIERCGESYYFHSYEKALEFAEEEIRKFKNWTDDEIEESITDLKEQGYVAGVIYLTERSFED